MKSYLIVFLLAFIPRCILCFFSEPVAVVSDEVATLAGGAYWAGLDWSGVVSNAGYYGTGFTALSAIFFRLTDNPRIIYILTAILCTIAQSIPAVIAYNLLRRYFKVQNNTYRIVVSIVCSYFVTNASIVIFNEHGLILLSWIIAWLFFKLYENIDNKRRKIYYTIILMVALAYGLTLHTRAILLWVALAITVLFFSWTYKRCLISIPAALFSGGLFYLIAKMYISYMQNALWMTGANGGVTLRNASIGGIGEQLKLLLSPQSWQAWFNIIFGQLHTVAVFSGGLFIVFIIVFINFLWNKLLRRTWDNEHLEIEKKLMPVVVFFAACIAMTIVGQSISWLGGSVSVIKAGFDNNLYATKAYGYLRYIGPYCGPILMSGAVYLYHWKEHILKYKIPIWGSIAFLEFYWLVCIFPYLYHTDQNGALEFYYPYSFELVGSEISWKTILPASFVLLLAVGVCWLLLKRQKWTIIFVITGFLFVYTYFYIGITWTLKFEQMNRVFAYNSYELVQTIADQVEIPSEIYVEDSWEKDDHNNYYMYQILLNRYKIIPEAPSDDLENAIFFTNDTYTEDNYAKYTAKGYKFYKVGIYELLLVKGESLQQQLIDAGIPLQ